jgi:hypothetical protein
MTDGEKKIASDDLLANLSAELLAKLSPHRQHESSWLKNLLCSLGLHRWYQLDLGSAAPEGGVKLCRWCPKVKVKGVS